MSYIEKEALLKELQEELEIDSPMLNEVENKWINKGIRIAIKDVKCFPTADVVEVRHGEWVKTNSRLAEMTCSLCGFTYYGEHDVECMSAFCPECGAKMDGERRPE